MTTITRFDPLQPEVIADPYAVYRELREYDPVHWGIAGDADWPGTWYVLAHDDVVNVLKDPRLGREVERVMSFEQRPKTDARFQSLHDITAQWMILRDPPQHTRLRSLVIKAFTPRMVERIAPRIEQVANDLIAHVKPAGRMDVIADFARVLPVMIIAEVLGVPSVDMPHFSPHAIALAAAIEFKQDDAVRQRGVEAVAALKAYVDDLFAKRRRDPQDDLISALVHMNDEDDLSEEELFGNVTMLLVAGNDPTMHLIGNTVHALLTHPDKLAELQDNLDLLDGAVDELLRYDSSVQMTFRYALQDVEIGGRHIAAGDHIALVFGSALRDPAYCDAPDEIRFDRVNNWLPFGGGIHFCPGNALAKRIGQVALRALITQLPDMTIATDKLAWQDTVAVRGLKSLPVQFRN